MDHPAVLPGPRIEAVLNRWDEERDEGGLDSAAAYLQSLPNELRAEVEPWIERILAAESDLSSPAGPAALVTSDADVGCGVAGRYTGLSYHARGGMAIVYKARDVELDREVAYKLINPKYRHDPEALKRFHHEAEATSRLHHPGIVPVYGQVTDASGLPAYAMEFVEGQTLADAIRAFHGNNVRAGEALRVRDRDTLLGHFVSACRIVAYAHDQGYVHGDLTPSNILIDDYEATRVIDWGVSRHAGINPPPEPEAGNTRRIVSAGYHGPSALQAGRSATFASDVCALGVTLRALLTGRLSNDPGHDPVRDVIPPALAAVCRKAMSVEPSARYPSPAALADDVDHFLRDRPVSVHKDRWPVRARRWIARHTAAAVAMLLIFVFGCVAMTASSLAWTGYLRSKIWYEGKARFEAARAPLEIFANEGMVAFSLRDDKNKAIETYDLLVRRAEERAASDYATDVDRGLLGRSYLLRGMISSPSMTPDVARRGYNAILEDLLRSGGLPRFLRTYREINDPARLKSTLQWCDKAVAAFDSVVAPDRLDQLDRDFRALNYKARASMLMQLNRHTEALLDLDRWFSTTEHKLDLSDKWTRGLVLRAAEQEQSKLPWSHGVGADHVKATRLAAYLADHEGVFPAAVYNAACMFSLASADGQANPAERRRRADRALSYLRRIADQGYFRADKPREDLQNDPDLGPVRNEPGFREILDKVRAKK